MESLNSITNPCVECSNPVTIVAPDKVVTMLAFICPRCDERIEAEKQMWFHSFVEQRIGENK